MAVGNRLQQKPTNSDTKSLFPNRKRATLQSRKSKLQAHMVIYILLSWTCKNKPDCNKTKSIHSKFTPNQSFFLSLYTYIFILSSGYVDSLLDEVTSRVRVGEMPHHEDVEDVPPPLCHQFIHPEKDVAVHIHYWHVSHEIKPPVLVIFCRKGRTNQMDCTGGQWNSNGSAKPSPAPSNKLSITDVSKSLEIRTKF